MDILNFDFTNSGKKIVENVDKGSDWPVVYLIHNKEEIYIGETTSASNRLAQHLNNANKRHLKKISIVFDETFNKSVILDYEQRLIKCFKADGKFKKILNRNAGQSSQHDYYQRNHYAAHFSELWEKLFALGMVQNSLDVLENRNIFKYSPFNSLTEEQNSICAKIFEDILNKANKGQKGISLVNGCAGTGKTVMAISMINSLANLKNLEKGDFNDDEIENEKIKTLFKLKSYVHKHGDFKIAIVFPMTGIRKSISMVFKEMGNGLTADMVIGPSAVKDQKFDILFVDEAHRLARRKNLGRIFSNFDATSKQLGINPESATQLDWILSQSKYVVLFYDQNQSIKSSDILHEDFMNILSRYVQKIQAYTLTSQMRCRSGRTYIEYIKNILNGSNPDFVEMSDNFEFKLFDDVQKMVDSIKTKDNQFGLSKTVAGYSWNWKRPQKTPKNDGDYYDKCINNKQYDIEIDGHKFLWNFVTEGWLNRLDSHDTIGCIHSTQGLDMNYVGVIFGREIDYNPETGQIEVDASKLCGQELVGCSDEETKKKYIINTYLTLLSRGIRGCYVYACNPNLRDYLLRFIKKAD